MPDLTLKDLPDVTNIQDTDTYLVQGRHWRTVVTLLGLLWRGENVGQGDVSPVQNGANGYSLRKRGGTPIDTTAGGRLVTPIHPYQGFDASTTGTPMVNIQYGTHNSFVPNVNGVPMVVTPITGNQLTLSTTDKIVYIEVDFDTTGVITSAEIMSSGSSTPPANVVPGDGSATGYQTLFAVSIDNTPAIPVVTIVPGVLTNQNCQICNLSVLFWV